VAETRLEDPVKIEPKSANAVLAVAFTLSLSVGCSRGNATVTGTGESSGSVSEAPRTWALATLRAGLQTQIGMDVDTSPAAEPPTGELQIVRYPSELGQNVAYLSPIPQDGTLRPAVVWVTGGFDWGLGAWAWMPAPADNDQSARQFRDNGVVTMYPAPRGSNGNAGVSEVMLGEVTDFIAAGTWLATQPGIDPRRVYLAGHSTGGTIALLAAESTGQFRAVFALGPASNVIGYDLLPQDLPEDELRSRSPRWWLGDITSPTWVIEGENGNAGWLAHLDSQTDNPNVTFQLVAGYDHFNIIVPALNAISAAILADTGDTPSIQLPPFPPAP
jgi:alpha/beta superfamily hydrolase